MHNITFHALKRICGLSSILDDASEKQHLKQESIFNIYLLMSYMYVYHKEVCSAHESQKGALLKLDLQKVVSHLKWVLGIKPRSQARAPSAPDNWAIFPVADRCCKRRSSLILYFMNSEWTNTVIKPQPFRFRNESPVSSRSLTRLLIENS